MQDLWASFARTHDPIPERAYLEARGYASTLQTLDDLEWEWPDFNQEEERVELEWGALALSEGLPETDRCEVLLGALQSS